MKRQINPTLAAYIEQRVARYGYDPSTPDPRLLFRLAAEGLVGIREEGGNNRGRLVELIQSTLGTADGEPWCMSLVQTCLAFAELKTGAVSSVFPSEHCLTVWERTPAAQRVKFSPLPGAIAIWRHGTTSNGHTGITLTTPNARQVFALVEGNTEAGIADGKVERDGGGAYRTERSLAPSGNMRLVGFLKPF